MLLLQKSIVICTVTNSVKSSSNLIVLAVFCRTCCCLPTRW